MALKSPKLEVLNYFYGVKEINHAIKVSGIKASMEARGNLLLGLCTRFF